MNLREGLGYTRLTPHEQQAYKIALSAFSAMLISFDITQVHCSVDLMKIITAVLGDNPNIIYFNKTQIKKVSSMFGKQIQLTGCLPKSQIVKMSSELEMKSNSIISSLRKMGDDEYSKLMRIYEYLQSNVQYDEQEFFNSSKGRSQRPNSHNAYGALINKLAVCDGYSSAFSFLAQKLGFDSMFVSGCSTYQSRGSVEHAWNIIRVCGRYYHFDVTWDSNQYHEFKEFSYDYFALDDEEMSNNHDWDINSTPACSYNSLSYFLKSGLYANNMGQLNDIIRASIKKHRNILRVKLSYNIMLPDNTGEYLAEMVINEGIKSGNDVEINYAWNEYTRCLFVKFLI